MTKDRNPDSQTEQRVDLLLKVEYSEPEDLLSDCLTTLGRGGMFIHTTFPFHEGDKIAFSISFPGLLAPLELAGIVRWRRGKDASGPGEPPGLGVEFDFDSDEKREELDSLIESLKKGVSDPEPAAKDEKFRVLLVEDNDFVQDLFAYTVRCFHYQHIKAGMPEIFRAADGQEALQMIQGQSIDLAIIDHFLPLMTGCELVRRIRQDPKTKDLPILVVSVGGAEVKREALESGADLFLDKPVLNKQLIQTISALLSRPGR